MDFQGRGNYPHPFVYGENIDDGVYSTWPNSRHPEPQSVGVEGNYPRADAEAFAQDQRASRGSYVNHPLFGTHFGGNEATRARNIFRVHKTWKPDTEELCYPRQWDGASQDARNSMWWQNHGFKPQMPNPEEEEAGYLPSVSEETNALGHPERPRTPVTDMQQLEGLSLGNSHPEQHPAQAQRDSPRPTPHQGDYQVPPRQLQPPIGTGRPRRLPKPDNAHPGDHPQNKPASSATQPANNCTHPAAANFAPEEHSPYKVLPLHTIDDTGTPSFPSPTPKPARPKYVSPVPPGWHKRLTLNREQIKQNNEACMEFNAHADKIIAACKKEEARRRELKKMKEDMENTAPAEKQSSTPAQEATAPAPASGSQAPGPSVDGPSVLPRDQQYNFDGFSDYTHGDIHRILSSEYVAQYGLKPADMLYAESAADSSGHDSASDDPGRAEQRERDAERIKHHRETYFNLVAYACMRLTGALGTNHGPMPPLPDPLSLIPGSTVRSATPRPPIINPLGLRNYEDLRSCLLEWGNRGGTASLLLQRITFFHAAPQLENGPLQPTPGPEKGFRGEDVKTLFAEDGFLAVHAVQIPDRCGEPKEWMWFELKQPVAEIHGNAPVEFNGRPEAWMIMAMPTEFSYLYAWHSEDVRGKAGTLQEKTVGPDHPDLPEAKPAAATFHVWSSDVLPSMQFSKKPRFVTDLVDSHRQDFLGIPFIGPYPQMVDETSDSAKDEIREWWGNLGAAMERDASCWTYMRGLMKNNILGMELIAEQSDLLKWERDRQLLAARQWTHSPDVGALAEFCEIVGPKQQIATPDSVDPKRSSGLQSEKPTGTS